MRRVFLAVVALLALVTPACYQAMSQQPSYRRPLEPSTFFSDGRSSRPPVPGTVARGQLRVDTALYEGRDGKGKLVEEFPFEITDEVLKRGRAQYNVFCAVCHGATGEGDGRIVMRGFTRPPSYTYQVNDEWLLADYKNQPIKVGGRAFGNREVGKLRQAGGNPLPSLSRSYQLRGEEVALSKVPVGHIYDVITRGFGAMADYGEQIPVNDRWAIVAYVRALQQWPDLKKGAGQ